jgi:hypothetical protein
MIRLNVLAVERELFKKRVDIKVPPTTVIELLPALMPPNQQIILVAEQGVVKWDIPSPEVSPPKEVSGTLLD